MEKTQIEYLINESGGTIRDLSHEKYINALEVYKNAYIGGRLNRNEYAKRVLEENPEVMCVRVRDIELELTIGWSRDKKRHSWDKEIDLELFEKIAGYKANFRTDGKMRYYFSVMGDCRVVATAERLEGEYWKLLRYQYIGEEFVKIL